MAELSQLNLPAFDAKIREREPGVLEIYDELRQKYVALTPEEWVRQHFVNFLVHVRNYPSGLMANEVGLVHNGCRRRCDTIIYNKLARPVAIVEYKASDVAITARVFDQIVRYNMVLDVNYLMVSNGLDHYCCYIRHSDNSYVFLKDIPVYEDLDTTL